MGFSRLFWLYSRATSVISGGFGDWIYRFVLFGLLLCFLTLRIPYFYGALGFMITVFSFIFPLFLGLLLSRLLNFKWSIFFSNFIPLGTPLELASFVCLAETLSYLIRPFVLMLRPFVNLTIGAMGACAIGGLSFFEPGVFGFLLILFFYEVFVTLVHWFIVCSILSFSESH